MPKKCCEQGVCNMVYEKSISDYIKNYRIRDLYGSIETTEVECEK